MFKNGTQEYIDFICKRANTLERPGRIETLVKYSLIKEELLYLNQKKTGLTLLHVVIQTTMITIIITQF